MAIPSYVISYSGGNIQLNVGEADTSNTSLTLIGRNYSNTANSSINGYGQIINQNYVNLLQNFANSVQPANPIKGQMWFDVSSNVMKVSTTNGGSNFLELLSNVTLPSGMSSGISNVSIPVADGNVVTSVAGVANVLVVTATGANIKGTGNVTGNFSAGNISTTGTATVGTLQTTTITAGSNVTSGTITGSWTLSTGSTLQSTYADLAEFYSIDSKVEVGTVVEFGGTEEIRICLTDMSSRIAGVISTDPAFVMNNTLKETPTHQMVALVGRVPCKVVGKTRKGDLMVSAGGGYARAEARPVMGSVIGKALENKDSDGVEIIEVVVGRL